MSVLIMIGENKLWKKYSIWQKKTNEYNITIPEEIEIPKSIAPIPRPNIEEIRSKKYSRFTI